MKVFIQNEAGSDIKNHHDEKLLKHLGQSRVSRPYPFPYGFILDTTADDGLNVDCFVITKRILLSGQIVECDPVGLMRQIEDGEEDHNVLAVLRGEAWKLSRPMMQGLVEFVTHVFDHVPNKKIEADGFEGPEAALTYVADHMDDAGKARPKFSLREINREIRAARKEMKATKHPP